MHYPQYHRFTATILLFFCTLLLQSCGSNFHSIIEECTPKKPHELGAHEPVSDQALAVASGSLPPDHCSDAEPSLSTHNSQAVSASLASGGAASLPSVASQSTAPGFPQSVAEDSKLAARPTSSLSPALSQAEPENSQKQLQLAIQEQIAQQEAQAELAEPSIPAMAIGSAAWEKYFGAVGPELPLPADIDNILDGPCPFWPGKRVKDTHLLVLIPESVGGRPFTLNMLEELIRSPKEGDYRTAYSYYSNTVKEALGDRPSGRSYWVLMTRDVLPNSRSKMHEAQKEMVAVHAARERLPYELPHVLEAATALLLHYAHTGECLYTDAPLTYTRCQEKVRAGNHQYSSLIGGFSSEGLGVYHTYNVCYSYHGVSCLRKFKAPSQQAIGAEAWEKYFGAVGPEPPLPADIDEILSRSCPFWPHKQVKDTHLLVLVPATVNGKPFTLNLLGELIRSPKGGGYRTEYKHYNDYVKEALGDQPSGRSYWVLMTRDVLLTSRNKTYEAQKALVAAYAAREGLPYELPHVLEAATALLLHYAHTGERRYTNDPWTYTRCQKKVKGGNNQCSSVVGGFSSGGLFVSQDDHNVCYCSFGVSCLRKF